MVRAAAIVMMLAESILWLLVYRMIENVSDSGSSHKLTEDFPISHIAVTTALLKRPHVTWVNLGDHNLHRADEFGKALKGTRRASLLLLTFGQPFIKFCHK